MSKAIDKYRQSKVLWQQWRKSKEVDPIQGYCMWEHDFKSFKLECWNVVGEGPVIFQFWPDGEGFGSYVSTNGPIINKFRQCTESLHDGNIADSVLGIMSKKTLRLYEIIK